MCNLTYAVNYGLRRRKNRMRPSRGTVAPVAVAPLTAVQFAPAPSVVALSSTKPVEAGKLRTRLFPLMLAVIFGAATGRLSGPAAKDAATCEGVIAPL